MSATIRYPIVGIPKYTNLAALPAASLNGDLAVALDTDTLYISNGTTWTAIGGSTTVLSVGALDGTTASANGASIVVNDLFMQSASSSKPGLINTTTQTIAGNKTLSGSLLVSGVANAVQFEVDSFAGQTNSLAVFNAVDGGTFLFNHDASVSYDSGTGVTLALGSSGMTLVGNFAATNFTGSSSGSNTGDVTLTAVGSSPSANAASISGQALTLQPADATHPGVVTTGSQTFAGTKTFSSTISASISGNAATATTATTATSATTATNATNVATTQVSSNASFFPLMVASSTNGNQACDLGTGFSFNPSTNTLTTTTFSGALSGNATTATSATTATTATNATNTAITDDTTTNATMYPTWVTTASSNQAQKVSSTKCTFNPSTGTFSATTFVGALTGTASGNTAYSANNHGVVLSGSANTMTVIAPDASTTKVLTSGGASTDPTWAAISTSSFGTQTAGTYLGGPYSGSAANPTFKAFQAPTIQKFTSGSGTYTTATGALYIRVRMIGGGGGGGGSGTTGAGTGGNGVSTTFGSSLLSANNGVGGGAGGNPGGAGGSASLGSGPIGTALSGGAGGGGNGAIAFTDGGMGGSGFFGGAGSGGENNNAGGAAATNTGGGGGGGGSGAGLNISGAGGGSGGFVDALISAPSATYAYTVGTAGAAGTAGTSGFVGGAGGSGYIEVTEYYQ